MTSPWKGALHGTGSGAAAPNLTTSFDMAARGRRQLTRPRTPVAPRTPSAPDLLRAAALGVATGARSSAGLTAVAWRSRRTDAGPAGSLARRSSRPLHLLMTAGEMAWDKHPSIPDRVSGPGLAPRVALGASTAGAVARRDGVEDGLPALVGAATAAGAALAGTRARAAARRRFGSDLPGALAEDALATAIALLGAGRGRRPRSGRPGRAPVRGR